MTLEKNTVPKFIKIYLFCIPNVNLDYKELIWDNMLEAFTSDIVATYKKGEQKKLF